MSIILIVDDNASARETVIAMLEGENYQIETAKDGFHALQILNQLQPDLILLDVMMPGMDGFEVCRRIRATPALAEVPIIMLTALDDRASLLMGLEAGADDFLTKPVDRYELQARVRTIVRLNRYRQLVEQRENLREMTERLIAAQEEERHRISRELHDDLGQSLTTQMISLHNLQNDLSLPSETLSERLQQLHDQSYEIFVKIRSLAHDLRPPVLDTLGLKVSMQTYCVEFTRRTRMPVTFDVDETLPPLPDSYNIALYRILQEALHNIVKHANASHVWVDLSLEENTITLTVQDNGQGFNAEEKKPSNGIGLSSMRERVMIAGGKFTISSAPNRGTILSAQFPLPMQQQTLENPS